VADLPPLRRRLDSRVERALPLRRNSTHGARDLRATDAASGDVLMVAHMDAEALRRHDRKPVRRTTIPLA